MVTKPTANPCTTPVVLLIGAKAGLLLLHVPPGVALASVVVPPRQTFLDPVMAATVGRVLMTEMVADVDAMQPTP